MWSTNQDHLVFWFKMKISGSYSAPTVLISPGCLSKLHGLGTEEGAYCLLISMIKTVHIFRATNQSTIPAELQDGIRKRKCPEIHLNQQNHCRGWGFVHSSWLSISLAGCWLHIPPQPRACCTAPRPCIVSHLFELSHQNVSPAHLCAVLLQPHPLTGLVSMSPRSVIPLPPTHHQTL